MRERQGDRQRQRQKSAAQPLDAQPLDTLVPESVETESSWANGSGECNGLDAARGALGEEEEGQALGKTAGEEEALSKEEEHAGTAGSMGGGLSRSEGGGKMQVRSEVEERREDPGPPPPERDIPPRPGSVRAYTRLAEALLQKGADFEETHRFHCGVSMYGVGQVGLREAIRVCADVCCN